MTLITIRSALIRQQLQVSFEHGSNGKVKDFQRHSASLGGRQRNTGVVETQSPCIVISLRLLPSATCFALLFIFLRHRANMKAVCWPLYPARFNGKRESWEKRIAYLGVYQRGWAEAPLRSKGRFICMELQQSTCRSLPNPNTCLQSFT